MTEIEVLKVICYNVNILCKEDALSLTTICKELFSVVAPSISQFKFNVLSGCPFTVYSPHSLIIRSPDYLPIISSLPAITRLSIFLLFPSPLLLDLPPTLTHLSFIENFSGDLPPLPPSITHLSFNDNFDKIIVAFPPRLTHLTLGRGAFNELPPFPHSLTHLITACIEPIDSLPPNLVLLSCKSVINCDLPPSLKHLSLYSKSPLSLPAALEYVNFGEIYDYPFALPPNLTTIFLGKYFNGNIGFLPNSVVHLVIGERFQQQIQVLPSLLQHLEFDSHSIFNHPFPPFPTTLRQLILGASFNSPLHHLPPSLTHLIFPEASSFFQKIDFPPSLTHVKLRNFFHNPLQQEVYNPLFLGQYILPLPQLVHLDLSNYVFPKSEAFRIKIPRTVREVVLPSSFNQPVATRSRNLYPLYIIPSTITHLTFGNAFNHAFDELPKSLISLTFGGLFNQPVTGLLPAGLQELTFASNFNRSVENLPSTLKKLVFGFCFNQPVNSLPQTLIVLVFGAHFHRSIDKLPPSLQDIDLHGCKAFVADPLKFLSPDLPEPYLLKFARRKAVHFPNSVVHK